MHLGKTFFVSWLMLSVGACDTSRSKAPEPSVSSTEAERQALAPATPKAPSPDPGAAANGAPALTRTFEADAAGLAPAGFSFGRTGNGRPGQWLVRAEPGAPSGGNVLVQMDSDATSFRFPVAVMNDPVVRDVRVSVRCKMLAGKVDQACGLVARYRDEGNYVITRANALENNIRLYTVKSGERDEIASHDVGVTPNVWHEYRLDIRAEHLEVFWDGQRVLDHHDSTFTGPGRTGVWTKADSITYFDDFKVEPLQ
jgi:hypothetical protein